MAPFLTVLCHIHYDITASQCHFVYEINTIESQSDKVDARLMCPWSSAEPGSDSVTSRVRVKKRAMFQIVLKHRPHCCSALP